MITQRTGLLLRTAAVIFALYAFGHTFGAMLHNDRGGAAQAAVVASMRHYTFVVQGTTRSYWDFYRGFGFFVSVTFVLMTALCWMVARLHRTHPAQARPLVLLLFLASIPMTVLAWTNFFAAPIVLGTLTTLLLGFAVIGASRSGREAVR